MPQKKKEKSKENIFEGISLDDYFLDNLGAPLRQTKLWKRISEEHHHDCCCCCCCCDKKEPLEKQPDLSVAWASAPFTTTFLTSGLTRIIRAYLSWTATAPPNYSVTIRVRIRDHNGVTVLGWRDMLTNQSLTDASYCEIGRATTFFTVRRYIWDFQAVLVDQSGSVIAQSALCQLDFRVDPTPSVPSC